MRRLLVFIFSVTVITTQAQDHLVTLQRDTLYGDIQILLPTPTSEDIILETDGDKRRFKTTQFLSFYKDSATYHPVKHQNKYRIMQLEKEGYLSLYNFRVDESYEFATKYLLKTTLEGQEVPNILFKNSMSSFLSDCDEVSEQVKNKEYKKKDLLEIIDAYNSCIQGKTEENIRKSPSNPIIALVNEVIAESQDSELNTLLNDIKSKLRKGENIPSYMIAALENTGPTSEKKAKLIAALKN